MVRTMDENVHCTLADVLQLVVRVLKCLERISIGLSRVMDYVAPSNLVVNVVTGYNPPQCRFRIMDFPNIQNAT